MIRDEKNFFNMFLYRETIFKDLLKIFVLENIRTDTLLITLLLQLSKNFNRAVIKKYIKNIRNFYVKFYIFGICNIFYILHNTTSIVSVLKKIFQ